MLFSAIGISAIRQLRGAVSIALKATPLPCSYQLKPSPISFEHTQVVNETSRESRPYERLRGQKKRGQSYQTNVTPGLLLAS